MNLAPGGGGGGGERDAWPRSSLSLPSPYITQSHPFLSLRGFTKERRIFLTLQIQYSRTIHTNLCVVISASLSSNKIKLLLSVHSKAPYGRSLLV